MPPKISLSITLPSTDPLLHLPADDATKDPKMPAQNPIQQKLDNANRKILLLKEKGYELIGDLPTCTEFVSLQQTFGAFLFLKDKIYYQFQIKSLFSDEILRFGANNEPVFEPKSSRSRSTAGVPLTPKQSHSDGALLPKSKSAIFLKPGAVQRKNSLPIASSASMSVPASVFTFKASSEGSPNSSPNTSPPTPRGASLIKVMNTPFIKATGSNNKENLGYIFALIEDLDNPNNPKYTFLTKENARLTFHTTLVSNLKGARILGGEIYFDEDGEIIFIDNKSGNYPFSDEEAIALLQKVFPDAVIKEKYSRGIIKEHLIKAELEKRLQVTEFKDLPTSKDSWAGATVSSLFTSHQKDPVQHLRMTPAPIWADVDPVRAHLPEYSFFSQSKKIQNNQAHVPYLINN